MTFKLPPFLLWFLVAAALNPCFSPASAQAPEDYTVSVSVADQSDAAREPALRNAVREIVERVSGSSLSTNPKALPLLGRANALVKQYSYAHGDKDKTQLVVVFEPSAVDAELRNLGLTVWGTAADTVIEISFKVSGVRSPQAYAKIISSLRAQPGVRGLSVRELGDNVLLLQARVEGSIDKLATALVRGKAFRRVDDENPHELSLLFLN